MLNENQWILFNCQVRDYKGMGTKFQSHFIKLEETKVGACLISDTFMLTTEAMHLS